jgi:hypothetical protein
VADFEGSSVQDVTVTVNIDNSIVVNWSAYNYASGYIVDRKEGFAEYEEVAEQAGLSYVDDNSIPGRFYSYRVTAFRDS